jgi:hypothetical protein
MKLFSAEPSCGCRFEQSAPAHHRRLIAIEREPMSSLVELIEMAATWHEIEYAETDPVIPPAEWIEFAETHHWRDRERVLDAFVALASLAPARATLAAVIPMRQTPADGPVFATC